MFILPIKSFESWKDTLLKGFCINLAFFWLAENSLASPLKLKASPRFGVISKFSVLFEDSHSRPKSVKNKSEFYNLRSHYLGKKSFVQNAFKELKNLDGKEKIKIAKSLNHLRAKLTD